VTAGEVLGIVADAFGDRESPVLATADGVVVGRSNLPLIHEGDALYHVARIGAEESPEVLLEDFQVDLRQPFLIGGGEVP
jgi:hypothetical protein